MTHTESNHVIHSTSKYYVGLMSGTSCDGIDAALVEVNDKGLICLDTHYQAYPDALRARLLSVIAGAAMTAHDFSLLDYQLATAYAEMVNALLHKIGVSANEISAIGLHGQTIDHSPPVNTWQLGSAAHVAALTGIDVIADFRTMDVALGGQGAPLAPALHQALFYQDKPLAVLNLGGIANLSYLTADGFIGFDTGPANCLMDLWVSKHKNFTHDKSGVWAASGEAHPALLASMLSEAYFSKSIPKSTGRELFNQKWLAHRLEAFPEMSAVDVQATLLQLTVQSIVQDVKMHAPEAQQLVVCGGGVHNETLMDGLSSQLAIEVISSQKLGVDPDHVESVLMAWLASQFPDALDLTDVTGAALPHVFGVKHFAKTGKSIK